MSYFEDQYDAWMDGGCEGDPTDINPDEYWADKIESCSHLDVKKQKVEGEDGKISLRKVCQDCQLIIN